MKYWRRSTVRRRLAVLLAGLIVVTGVVLLAASYELVRANLNSPLPGAPQGPQSRPHGKTILHGTPPARPPSPSVLTIRGQIAHHTLEALLVQYGVILVGLVAAASLLAWLIAGRMLRPLRAITAAARRITGEQLGERLTLAGPRDELRVLGDTFDSMLDRLEVAFRDQQLFAANAAHELRTPLAVMRAELDLALTGPEASGAEQRQLAVRLRRAVTACEQLTERLLVLTRGVIAPADRKPVQLSQIARARLAAAGEAARKHGLTIRAELNAVAVHGDPSLLSQLIDNLIENATKYNRPRGWIAVTTRIDQNHGVLKISNSGPNLAGEQLSGLLEPFRRASQQRVGDSTGLGLSIVRTIVEAHEGKLTLEALTDGGLSVTVMLPALPGGIDKTTVVRL